MTTKADAHTVGVRRGAIYLSRELCDAHLADVEAVAVLARAADMLIVPLIRHSAGGLLLKLRSAHGDRVLHAQEFLREHGVPEDFVERRYPVRWVEDLRALAIPLLHT